MNNFFEEHQYQRRLLPWLLVTGIWTSAIWYIYNNGNSAEHPISGILVVLLFPISISVLLYFFRLSIKIDNEFVQFKMFPFHWTYRRIKLKEIFDAKIEEYNTGRSFHGWGMGFSWNNRQKSYTIKGYQGVKLSLKNGTEVFLGTQQPELLIKNLRVL